MVRSLAAAVLLCGFSAAAFAHRSTSVRSTDPSDGHRVPARLETREPIRAGSEDVSFGELSLDLLTDAAQAPGLAQLSEPRFAVRVLSLAGQDVGFGLPGSGVPSIIAGLRDWKGAPDVSPAALRETAERLGVLFGERDSAEPAAVPFEEQSRPRSATIHGVTTRYVHAGREHAGNGPPILLVHGFCASVFSWRYVLPELAKHFEVIAFDLPGFGRADKPRDFDYSLAGLADWTLAFQRHLGIEKAHWAASSMGAAIALQAALKEPERIARLALIGPVAFPEDQLPGAWRFTTPVVGRVTEWILRWYPKRWLLSGIYTNPERFTDEVVAVYGGGLKPRDARRAIREVVRKALPPDAAERVARYREIENAALILGGALDRRVPPGSFLKLSRTLANATLKIVEGAGHVPHEDAHELVLPDLIEFLRSPDSDRRSIRGRTGPPRS